MTDNRPEFLRMIAEAKDCRFDVVLVHKLDRFARNRQDSIGYRMQLKRYGVSLISILEYIDDSPESIILESVLEAMAEYYSKNLAREVNKGMRENALKGMHTGGLPPLGYDVDPQTRKLVINGNEAEAVRLIYDLFLEGLGYDKIINELNLRGYKTKTGSTFGHNSIHNIVRNEKYIGIYIFNRSAPKDVDGKRNHHQDKDIDEIIRIDDAVPPIISKSVFTQVQHKIEERKNCRASNCAKEVYLLAGKIFCGECGYTMGGNKKKSGRDKKTHITYRCCGRKSKHTCTNKEIRREYIEAYVLDELAQYLFDDKLIGKIASEYQSYQMETNADGVKKRDALKKRITESKKEINNLITLAAKTGSEILIERINGLEAERARLTESYEQLSFETSTQEITTGMLKERFDQAKALLRNGELSTTKKLINQFVNKVLIYQDHVEVIFNFHPDLIPPLDGPAKKSNNDKDSDTRDTNSLDGNKNVAETGVFAGRGKTPLASTKTKPPKWAAFLMPCGLITMFSKLIFTKIKLIICLCVIFLRVICHDI
jgi:site-specific DNA recombinase